MSTHEASDAQAGSEGARLRAFSLANFRLFRGPAHNFITETTDLALPSG